MAPSHGALPPTFQGPPAVQPRLFDWLAVGLLLTYVWRIQDLYPILGSVKFPILVSLAALGCFLMQGHASRGMPRFKHPIVSGATFLLVWMVLSVPGGVYPGLSFSFIVNDHVKTYLMMLIIIASIRGFADVERLVMVQVAGAGIYCVKILTSFEVGASGRLGDLFYYDSNDLAMLIVCALPLAVYFLRGAARPAHRLVALACAGVFVVAIIQSGSRGGFLGLIAVGAYLLFAYRAIPARVRFGAVAACALLLFTLAGPRYWEMMSTLLNPQDDYNWSGNNEVGRMAIWQRGIGYMERNPVFGVGANAFPVAEGTLSAISERQQRGVGLKWSAAHNSFVQIGAELGVPGLIAFVLIIGRSVASAWGAGRARRGEEEPAEGIAPLGQALVGSLVGYVVCGFFLSQGYSSYLYSTFAIVVGLLVVAGERAPSARPRSGSPARGRGEPIVLRPGVLRRPRLPVSPV